MKDWLFVLLFCFPVISSAQSMYDMDGYKFATKLDENRIEVTGSIFVIKNGMLIETFDGKEIENIIPNYYVQEEGKIKYFNREGRYVAYLIPSENRFYMVKQGKEDIHVALLYNNDVYMIDEKPRYKIDPGFDPELVGALLFFFLILN